MSQFKAEILKDSVNVNGERLTTFELTYPRFIHSELMTHRAFSRNSASSRAIPVEKMLANIQSDPVVPIHWGSEQKGMQAGEQVDDERQARAVTTWLAARDAAVDAAKKLGRLGIHKQITNRLVEPFMWITVICSTTSFLHFRKLRVHPAAEPHFQKLAGMMADLYDDSLPELRQDGEWHLPLTGFAGDESLSPDDLVKVSVARCARVSYLTHSGERDVSADIQLFDRLASNGHWSPFEHAARADSSAGVVGNFTGWIQSRKTFQNEFVRD